MIKFKKILISSVLFLLFPAVVNAAGNDKDTEHLVARRISPTRYEKTGEDLSVHFIDVGQGNAVFIETPSGKNLLYDGGGSPAWMKTSWDPGERIVVPYIKKLGYDRIDYVIVSHAHGDHIAGLVAVLKEFDIGVVFDPGYDHTGQSYTEFLEVIDQLDISFDIMRAGQGDKIDLGEDIVTTIFGPPEDYYFRGTNSDINNNSIVLKLKYGEVNFLFPGDLETRGEKYCVRQYREDLTANVLQVGHHGSRTSSTMPFLRQVLPEVAVIPVGENNTFGHPRPEALNNLEQVGAEIYRTDYDGTVIVYTNGEQFVVETAE